MRSYEVRKLFGDDGKAEPLEKPSDLSHLLFMASKGRNGIRNQAMIWMLYGSGLRVGEVAQIKIRDVFTKSGTLKSSFVIPGAITKTSKARTVYMTNKHHRAAVVKWLDYRKTNGGMLGDAEEWSGFNPKSPVFIVHRNGWRKFAMNVKKYKTATGTAETMVCGSLENLIREIHKNAGFVASSSHSGRRTIASWMERKGFDIKVIQKVLGHESIDMTAQYIDPDAKRIKEALNTFWGSINFKD